VETGLTVPRQ